jgi:hypothetical protein
MHLAVRLAWAYVVERVTRIELALSAWESDRLGLLTTLTWTSDVPLVTVMDPATPGLMARQWPAALQPGRVKTMRLGRLGTKVPAYPGLTSPRRVADAARRGCHSRGGQLPALAVEAQHRHSREREFLALLGPAAPPLDRGPVA